MQKSVSMKKTWQKLKGYFCIGYDPRILSISVCRSTPSIAFFNVRSVLWPSRSTRNIYFPKLFLLGLDSIFTRLMPLCENSDSAELRIPGESAPNSKHIDVLS